jgi:hypothetical protein
VKYQTAWFMMHRLRYAMGTGPLADKLRGVIEMDETYIGGRGRTRKGRVPSDKRKAMIIALVERDGRRGRSRCRAWTRRTRTHDHEARGSVRGWPHDG